MAEILVTGATGLVGSRFKELYGSRDSLLTPSHEELDILNRESTKRYFGEHQPEAVVNFAADTNVSGAENQRNDQSGSCWQINVLGTRNLLEAAGDQTRFIQISTDMVFPGSSLDPGPYHEGHPLPGDSAKVTWYGWTKGEAERLVQEKYGHKATILRLIYPVRAKFDKRLDYLRKPLKLITDGKTYTPFTDQQMSITFIDEVALALEKIIDIGQAGIFHASSRDLTNPYDLISYLLDKLGKNKSAISPATTTDPRRYPKFGGLKIEETEKRLGIVFSTWREIVDKLIDQGINI